MIFACPRCLVGQMDSEKGEQTACWFCSNYKPCYVCSGPEKGPQCGSKFCAPCVTKMSAKNKSPKPPLQFKPGELGNG